MFQKYLKDFKSLKTGQKVRIYIVLFFCFTFTLLTGIWYKQALYKKIKPVLSPPPKEEVKTGPVKLLLTSSVTQIKVGESFTVTATLDSGGTGVDAADFVVNFDPKVLSVTTVSEGNYFKLWPIKITGENFVKISGISALENNKIVIPTGKAPIMTITFTALQPSDKTQIAYDPVKTIVASKGKNIVDAGKLEGVKISVIPSETK